MGEVSQIDSKRLQALAVRASRAYVDSGLHGIRAEVVLALDVSREMSPLYASDTIQNLTAGLIALAMRFDNDGVIPAFAFGSTARSLGDLRHDDFTGWVDRAVIRTRDDYQDECRYAPVINAIGSRYFPEEWGQPPVERQVGGALKRNQRVYPSLINKRKHPIFVIVITGGECHDPSDAARAIRRSSHLPLFFQFAGLSPSTGPRSEFEFLRKLDRLADTYIDNCGFFEPTTETTEEALFDGLLNEFPVYLELQTAREMLLPPSDDDIEEYPQDDLSDDALLEPDPAEVARHAALRDQRQRRRQLREIAARQAAGKSLNSKQIALMATMIGEPGDDDTLETPRSELAAHTESSARARLERIRAQRAARRLLKKDE